jgi:serine/threonine protein kinase
MSDSVPPTPAPPSIHTADAFLRMVRMSDLVEPGRMADVEAAVASWRAAEGPMPEACLQALVASRLLTQWQIEKLCQGRSRGFFLGKCKLLHPIGKGGMGNVYLAEHTTLKARRAVKVLPLRQEDSSTPEQRERFAAYLRRFEREARAAAALTHPNIAGAYDLGVSEGANHFIEMEYVDGLDLDKRVKADGPLPVRDAADIVRQAALGLEHAHEEGLVHRDIKPANLMVDSRGQLKILDLGLVQVDASEAAGDPSAGQEDRDKIMGTPDYMSPEQALARRIDRRSDIYSLGCTFYYLLTREPPFERTTVVKPGGNKRVARMRAHVKQPAPNVLDVRPDVPVEIVELILRMMEKAPEARPQTAREVAESLAAWLAASTATQPRVQPNVYRRSASRQSTVGAGGTADAAVRAAGSAGPPAAAAAAAGTWATFDVHAPSHSDIHGNTGVGRSSGSMAPETIRGAGSPTVGGDAITFDTDAGHGPPAASLPRPLAEAGQPVTATPRSVGKAWLFRRILGLPLVAWACLVAAIVSAGICAGLWWQTSGAATEGEEDDPVTAVEKPAASPPPRKQKAPPQPPPMKRRPKAKTSSDEGGEPSPLDRMLAAPKSAAEPAAQPPADRPR